MSNTSTKIFFQKKVHNIQNWAAIYVLYTQNKTKLFYSDFGTYYVSCIFRRHDLLVLCYSGTVTDCTTEVLISNINH